MQFIGPYTMPAFQHKHNKKLDLETNTTINKPEYIYGVYTYTSYININLTYHWNLVILSTTPLSIMMQAD